MNMFRTGNPVLKETAFVRASTRAEGVMTLDGTVNKTGLSLLILAACATLSWNVVLGRAFIVPSLWIGGLGGFVLALATTFKPAWAPVTTPAYAVCEGLLLGTISMLFNLRYPGIALNAVALTFGILLALLAAYRSGLIRPSENVKLGIAAATGGVFLVYLASMAMSLFGRTMPLIHSTGLMGIAFSLVVVALASANLVLDFDFIEQGVAKRAPKYMEWYGAFGLLVTLVWLYLEILRLLAKLQDRKK